MATLSSKPPAAYYADHDSGGDQRLAAVWLKTAAYYAATWDATGFCIITGYVVRLRMPLTAMNDHSGFPCFVGMQRFVSSRAIALYDFPDSRSDLIISTTRNSPTFSTSVIPSAAKSKPYGTCPHSSRRALFFANASFVKTDVVIDPVLPCAAPWQARHSGTVFLPPREAGTMW